MEKVKTKMLPLAKIKANQQNPRVISESKLKKLINSLLVFPKMMSLRPITLDDDGFVLGGNMRLSPFIPQFVEQGVLDMNAINSVKCDKILVEFLRVNTWIRKWFDIDYSDYTLKQSGYEHLPLEKIIEYLRLIRGDKQLTVCEDVDEHYIYWQQNVNHNPQDFCNLTKFNP